MQLDSYSFSFPTDGEEARRVLLPLLDLINHDGQGNTLVTRHLESRTYRATALRPIRCSTCRSLSQTAWP